MNVDTPAQVSRAAISLIPVESSTISDIGHDPATDTLAIRFRPRSGKSFGRLYHYGNVGTDIFAQLKGAPSVGSFFHKTIKPDPTRYPYVLVQDDSQA